MSSVASSAGPRGAWNPKHSHEGAPRTLALTARSRTRPTPPLVRARAGWTRRNTAPTPWPLSAPTRFCVHSVALCLSLVSAHGDRRMWLTHAHKPQLATPVVLFVTAFPHHHLDHLSYARRSAMSFFSPAAGSTNTCWVHPFSATSSKMLSSSAAFWARSSASSLDCLGSCAHNCPLPRCRSASEPEATVVPGVGFLCRFCHPCRLTQSRDLPMHQNVHSASLNESVRAPR